MGIWRPQPTFYPKQYYSDMLMFGFKVTDSFYITGQIAPSDARYKCVEVPALYAGAPPERTQAVINSCLRVWTYNSSTDQLSNSEFSNDTVCLQARGGGTAPGTPVEMYRSSQPGLLSGQTLKCSEATFKPTAAQQWTVSSDGTIMNVGTTVGADGTIARVGSGLCVEPLGGSTADGTGLVLNTCNGSSAQRWVTPWKTRLPGSMRAPATNSCLNVKDRARADGTPLQMYACDANWAQNWYYDDVDSTTYNDDGSVKARDLAYEGLTVYGGTKCMVGGGYTLSVVVDDCNGSTAQKWTLNADGTIRPKIQPAGATLCLDRANGSTANETAIQLIPCAAGNPAQKWTWPLG